MASPSVQDRINHVTAMFCIQNAVVESDMPTQNARNVGTLKGDQTEVAGLAWFSVMSFSLSSNALLRSGGVYNEYFYVHLD